MSPFAGFSRQNLNSGHLISFFYLMHSPAGDATLNAELQVCSEKEWIVSCSKRYRACIILCGMAESLSTLEVRTKLVDTGLVGFARGYFAWEGDHNRLLLLPRDSKGLNKDVVRQISARLRKIGCR